MNFYGSFVYLILRLDLYQLCVCVLGFLCSCPYLVTHVSPVVPVFTVVLMVLTLASLIRTATMDPGVLPRAVGVEASLNEFGRNDTLGVLIVDSWLFTQFEVLIIEMDLGHLAN